MKTINQKLMVDDKMLIDHVHFTIDDGEHIAIIGDNGIGKSVLMRQLAEQFNTGILEQSIEEDSSVLDFIIAVNPQLYQLKQQKNLDINLISDYIEQGGYELENEIIQMMKRFNLNEEMAEQNVSLLSGGEQTKVGLIKLLSSQPDIFLFDEPTNHIDGETKEWLKNWMKQSKETIIFVSHDRDFINDTASKIVELNVDGSKTYHLNYDCYLQEKERMRKENAALIDKERKEKQKMKRMIQEMKEWHHEAAGKAGVRDPGEQKKVAKIAKRYKSKEHQLQQKIDHFEGKSKKEFRTDLSIHSTTFNARQFARFEHVGISFDNRKIISDVTFTIEKGDKIAVEGRNGSGKSTLLKLLIGELSPNEGKIAVNPETHIGYFSQQLQQLNLNNTVLEEILENEIDVSFARTILASFRFTAERMDDIVEHLSMGEKCRLAFVKLYFSEANLLVLDEPTNYFDITMQQIVENMLVNYQGAIIFVSHDRYFNQAVANRHFVIEQGKLVDKETVIEDEIDARHLKGLLNDLSEFDQ
ncbi:ribosomal protection-like ABC-F family protein [Macrococcus lamae]|uniref:ABC-F family ATP-binding cassette domain-containing protein n=1 Tax=Macrococcus lamae TaxID=198484 RepID=A0A4V3BEY2_9STAP|nr:ABC-F family ATP-binding cassette domain-containing protein [Macrococcus lamae]TDM11917.1 ABC-F family ATP-binding cassette domain-containing protein [Macrococcus lamae]